MFVVSSWDSIPNVFLLLFSHVTPSHGQLLVTSRASKQWWHRCLFLIWAFGVASPSEFGLMVLPVSCQMSLLLERQIERLERAIELSSDWLEIQYLMAELDQLKDLYEEPDVEAAWSLRFVSTAFASFGCRFLFGKPSLLDCSRDPVALNLCRSCLIACPVSFVINSFCRLFYVLWVLAFIWIISELANADVDNRETCLKTDNSIDCMHRLSNVDISFENNIVTVIDHWHS